MPDDKTDSFLCGPAIFLFFKISFCYFAAMFRLKKVFHIRKIGREKGMRIIIQCCVHSSLERSNLDLKNIANKHHDKFNLFFNAVVAYEWKVLEIKYK